MEFPWKQSSSARPAPHAQDGTPLTPSFDPTLAAAQARQEFLRAQALAWFNQIRAMKVSLLIADMAGELPDDLRTYLCDEFMGLAGLCPKRPPLETPQ